MEKVAKPAPDSYGICIKNEDRTVEYQNSACEKLCGDQMGKKCEKSCMKKFRKENSELPIALGFHSYRNLIHDEENEIVDAVLLNDGEKLITFLYSKKEILEGRLVALKQYDLTSAELTIIEKVVRGLPNRKIAEELFISKSTLRTHLNNIYKKLPADFDIKTLRESA